MIKNSVKRFFSSVFFLLFVFAGVFSPGVFSFEPSFDDDVLVEWTKTYGGDADDSLYAVKQASDGGFLLAGTTESFGATNSDILVIKTDEFGVTEWTKIVGGQGIDRVWSHWKILREILLLVVVLADPTHMTLRWLYGVLIPKETYCGIRRIKTISSGEDHVC